MQPLLRRLSVAELASLLLVQQLGQAQCTHANPERTLAQLIDQLRALLQSMDMDTLTQQLAPRFSAEQIQAGLAQLDTFNIEQLDRATRKAAPYLHPNGAWDFTFCARYAEQRNPLRTTHRLPSGQALQLSEPQQRLLQSLLHEPDEPLNLQAFAGTGKTHLIGQLLDCLGSERTLVLAQTEAQLLALKQRFGSKLLHSMTFSHLALHCLTREQAAPRPAYRLRRTHQVSDAVIAERMGFQPLGSLSATQVATRCRLAVARFCSSGDGALHEGHLPERDLRLSPMERGLLMRLARQLWLEIIAPQRAQSDFPVRGYHLIKQLALRQHSVLGAEFTHVLVDESHDVPIPLLQFLDRCPQATHTLGDSYQHLNGFAPQRAGHVRQRQWFVSMRAGREMESVLNPLLTAHPRHAAVEFVGNRAQRTKISVYDRPTLPDHPVTLLVHDEWSLFEWAQRLSGSQAAFALLPGCQRDLDVFMQGCVELYHRNTPSGHGLLFRFAHWSALAAHYAQNPAFQRIQRLLERGYNLADFQRTRARWNANPHAPLQLGRVKDARNQEFDAVMLTPDLLTLLQTPMTAEALSVLYTACSRARHHLIIPGVLHEALQALGGLR